ncbi:hypothetical protein, partial [Achromobacter xylosoxidans]|uniref:hypothetical protein n=1 Tax=Alcaligenes xylosoxydans xylosoxydans TaxID=85698 RepID=UPI000A71E6FD
LAAPGGLLATPAGLVADAGALARIDHRPAMAANTAGGRSVSIQGDTITIHISGAGAGAQDIARAVDDALRRRDADKAARLRSAYYDNE